MVDVAKWVDTPAVRRLGRRSSDHDSRRERLVEAAIAAIEAEGPGVGTAKIAERAGLPRPHVYRVFASKDDLDAAVTRAVSADLRERVRPTMARPGTAAEIVRGVVAAFVTWASDHPQLYRFLAARQQTRATHRQRTGRSRFLGEIVTAATAYLRSGDIDHEVPDGVLASLMGMVDAGIIWWLDHHDEDEVAVVARLTRQALLILRDMLDELGLELSDDAVLGPL